MKTEEHPNQTITRALRAATPWFLEAQLQARPEGWAALIRLNPTMAKVRAKEQGLADSSLAAAAEDARVRRMWDLYVARVNAALPPDAQIVTYTPMLDTTVGDQ
jgi:hypothetical protein